MTETAKAPCSICGRKWEDHYSPDLLCFKMGPFGTFGLVADHAPHLPGVHAPREKLEQSK